VIYGFNILVIYIALHVKKLNNVSAHVYLFTSFWHIFGRYLNLLSIKQVQ